MNVFRALEVLRTPPQGVQGSANASSSMASFSAISEDDAAVETRRKGKINACRLVAEQIISPALRFLY